MQIKIIEQCTSGLNYKTILFFINHIAVKFKNPNFKFLKFQTEAEV